MSEQVTVQDLDKLVEKILRKREEIEVHQEVTKALNKEMDELEGRAVAFLKELSRDNYSSPHGTIYQIQKYRVSLPKTLDDKQAFFAYLQSHGIFMEYATVNSNSLNALYMKSFEAAKEQGDMSFNIPGIGAPQLFETIGFRRKQ